MFQQWHADLIRACMPLCLKLLKDIRERQGAEHGAIRIIVDGGNIKNVGWTPLANIAHQDVQDMACGALAPGDPHIFTVAIMPADLRVLDVYQVTPMLRYSEFPAGFTIVTEFHARVPNASKPTIIKSNDDPFGDL